MDLRQEFDQIIEENGFPILLQRSSRKVHCRCWSERYMEGTSQCPFCAGSGYLSRIERHMTKRKSAMQVLTRPNLHQQTDLGKSWISAYTLYLRHNVHPRVGDVIYEVGWNGQKPTNLIQAYRINDVDPVRGERGRIEYWVASVKAETMQKDFKQIVVRSIGRIRNYEIIQ